MGLLTSLNKLGVFVLATNTSTQVGMSYVLSDYSVPTVSSRSSFVEDLVWPGNGLWSFDRVNLSTPAGEVRYPIFLCFTADKRRMGSRSSGLP